MKPKVASLILGLSAAASAAGVFAEPADQKRTVVAGERYRKSGLHRFVFGSEYRDLWTLPVAIDVLDFEKYAGGLTPVRVLGHGQTKVLALKGADGNAYTFRPVLKDPTGLLPIELRDTYARSVVVDQMASEHPAGHVVAPGLLAPVGVLHNEPKLVVMPDDAVLGEFREMFAGVVGDIEEFGGTQGFAGSSEMIDGEELWKRLRASPATRADSREYLRARLVDQLMGDWDRHRDQWRWAKIPGKPRFQPVPEDRDQAFVRFEGFAIWLLRPQLPLLVKFGPGYSSLEGLTFDGWDVDKRLLAELDKPVWDEVAKEVQARLTDAVIEAAARRMPPEYFALDGERLIAGLKARRDHLPEHADRFYRFINRTVDVFGTDESENVEARRYENGDLELSVRVGDAEPYFQRRFSHDVTHEVRLYLYGGNDKVVVTGGHHGGVLLRVVAGDGVDVVDDSKGGGTRVSASDADDRVIQGPGTHWDKRRYPPPPPNKSGDWIPARDWGRMTGPLFLLSGGGDYGLLIGGSLNTTGYGFRKDPWADQQSLRLQYSTSQAGFRGTYTGQFRFENSPFRLGIFALGSGIEVARFFGEGNATTYEGNQDNYKIEQDRFHLEPALIYGVTPNFDLSLGLQVKYNHTEPRTNPLLTAPFYGEGDFTQFGATWRARLDATDHLALPRKGIFATAGAAFYPEIGDVEKNYGEVHGQFRTFIGFKGELTPTLSLKGGGQRVFGEHPFFDSAFLGGKLPFNPLEPGGASGVRGLPAQRYAGDGSLFGGVDLYVPLTRAFLLVPGQFGVTGFFDVGRVFLDGETSDRWHQGYGGGLFFLTPGRRNLVSVTVGHSEGNTALYVRGGFAF